MRSLTESEHTLTCSTCASGPGEHCTKHGGAIAARPHKAREDAWAAGSPPEAPEATETPTTGRLDPNDVVVPGEAPIFEALVAEKQAEARAEREAVRWQPGTHADLELVARRAGKTRRSPLKRLLGA